ncbi:MAG: hypothetical protein LLH30_16330 [Candidatus Manganitrophus sp. SA1]|nr:hypothetical protein [Candidatus Manganitrophus morganii]
MKKGFLKQSVRYFAVVLIIPTLISCGSSGGSNSEKDPATPSSLTNETPPATPASTGDQTTEDATPASTAAIPAANPIPVSTDPVPVPADPAPAEGGGTPSGDAVQWQVLGARVNAAQRGAAVWLTLAAIENAPVVSWEEDGKIYTGFWNGTEWDVEGPLNVNPNEAATLPSLASDGERLFLTWIEGRSLYLVRREEGTWSIVAVQTYQDGCGPANAALDVRQGVPTVAWDSFCSDSRYASTRVQQWAGTWVDLGGVGSHYADAPSPRKYALGADDQNLSLAVLMQNAASDGIELALFHRTEESWLPAGGPANDPLTFFSSTFSLAFVQDIPTLAFQQGGIQARQWNGEAWVTLGSPLSQDGVDPALMEVKGEPTLAFGGSSVEVWRWNGTAWTRKGEPLNETSGSFSWSTSLAASGQRLYAAWIENGFVFVKALPVQ